MGEEEIRMIEDHYELNEGQVVNGIARLTMKNLNIWEGNITDGKRNGYGRLMYTDGGYFEGYIIDDYITG